MGENEYPIGGYAPGNYTCKCCICGNTFRGDKRAVQCKPCAIQCLVVLPKEIQERIKHEAEKAYPIQAFNVLEKDAQNQIHGYMLAKQQGYIAGASVEAMRAQGLVDMLQKVLNIIQPYTPHQIREIKKLTNEALNKYKHHGKDSGNE